ncbi:hypothetical protein KEM54_005399 [Ascosphaera aggregata]|nr:hypothetical protein KEM54_005399 [Ascosphaera aggregata]
MPSFSRIFKHSHRERDKDRERRIQHDAPTSALTQANTATSLFPPTGEVPSPPDYAQALHFSKSKKKKDKDRETPEELARRAEKEKQRFAALKRQKEIDNDAWQKTSVDAHEVVELLSAVSKEIKARGTAPVRPVVIDLTDSPLALDIPFLLLPFRPSATSSDLASARTFIRHYFKPPPERPVPLKGEALQREVKLVDPPVLCSLLKWCWARLKGGVVGWEVYSLFKVGEQGIPVDSELARTAFSTFIPIAVDPVRATIITDFFDLLASIAAHSKSNGLAGRKLSRYAGWWAFEHVDTSAYVAATSSFSAHDHSVGFQTNYNNWEDAANATSHLFFAYLRSLTPDPTVSIQSIPTSLRSLERDTEYPPQAPALLRRRTIKVVMVVNRVSPTPCALLKRATGYDYDALDMMDVDNGAGKLLQRFTDLENPAQQGLTEECARLLKSISKANHSTFGLPGANVTAESAFATAVKQQNKDHGSRPSSPVSVSSTSSLNLASLTISNVKRQSWSRFEDLGFDGVGFSDKPSTVDDAKPSQALERPCTPSWADFLSSGFADTETSEKEWTALQLPHDNVLPPLAIQKGDGHLPRSKPDRSRAQERAGGSLDLDSADRRHHAASKELASVTTIEIDDSFFWVWISSLAPEETPARKGVFGRCALVETKLRIEGTSAPSVKSSNSSAADSTGNWLIFEEQIKGAAPKPDEAAVVIERKGTLFGLRNKLSRSAKRRSLVEPVSPTGNNQQATVSTNAITEFDGMTGLTTDAQIRPKPSMAVSVAPDQHARIQAAAAALQRKDRDADTEAHVGGQESRPKRQAVRQPDYMHQRKKTESLPVLDEGNEALKWAMMYDQHHNDVSGVQEVMQRKPVTGGGEAIDDPSMVQKSISGSMVSSSDCKRNAANSTTTSRPGSRGSSIAATISATRSPSSPFQHKPASLAPSITSTTTVTSRSILPTDASLSETTSRNAQSRPEAVECAPHVLAAPANVTTTSGEGKSEVAGIGSSRAKNVGLNDSSVIEQMQELKIISGNTPRAVTDVGQQRSMFGPAQQTSERNPRGTSRGSASASVSAAAGSGLVAAKRAALEKRDAAAKAPSPLDRKESSPWMSPTRSGSRSPASAEDAISSPACRSTSVTNVTLPQQGFTNVSGVPGDSAGSLPNSSSVPAGHFNPSRSQPMTENEYLSSTRSQSVGLAATRSMPHETIPELPEQARSQSLRVHTSPSYPRNDSIVNMTAPESFDSMDSSHPYDRWTHIRGNAAQRAPLQSPTSATGSAHSSPFELDYNRTMLSSQRDSWMSDSVRSSFESARTSTAPTKIKRVSVNRDPTAAQVQGIKSDEDKENQWPNSGGSETSKEESIEDRVARIKARVAQLTGAAPDTASQSR